MTMRVVHRESRALTLTRPASVGDRGSFLVAVSTFLNAGATRGQVADRWLARRSVPTFVLGDAGRLNPVPRGRHPSPDASTYHAVISTFATTRYYVVRIRDETVTLEE